MAAPIVWGIWLLIGGGIAYGAKEAGEGAGEGAKEAGEGLGDGLRFAVPLAVAGTAVYLFMNKKG